MAEPKTGKRFSLKDRGQWLPAVALFLCLALFAMAAIVLVGANSEPVTGHQANVTSVSAQGDQGLKRLLLARGRSVVVNRDEDGPDPLKAGLEIITLDSDQSNFLFGRNPDRKTDADSASASSSSVSSSAAQSASADAGSQTADDDTDLYGAPDPKRVNHILYHPLGRAVLVVLPKWNAAQMEKHPLWDADPSMVPWPVMIRTTELLAPATQAPVPAQNKLPPLADGRMRLIAGDRLITYDRPHGTMWRDTRAKTAAEIKADKAQADLIKSMGGLEIDQDFVPLRRHWALPAQNGFPALDLGVITGLQSLTAPNLTPVLTTVDGRVILSRLIVTGGRPQPKAPVYVLSDPDLLNNLILSDPKRVVAALSLIDALMPPADKAGKADGAQARPDIVFNITFNALGFDHDLLHTLTRPPFIAAPLCLLLTGLALMWAAFSRFGPPRSEGEGPPLGRGVRVLADNAARLLALTLKEAKLAPAYARHVRDLVLKDRGYMQISQGQPPDDLAERIGQAHHTQDSYLDLKSRAERAMTVHQLIDITRRLHAWKTEIERAHI
ncbi:hypothetical protein [Asticcacaulis sp. EMRT-3]|uniref:hypothetical protein n=1 Tax=Asticcacaulis sp. EMRT-3 TaxID=3040349 RepID=UPI0024AEF32D|nr:hypothetical protein [Asticcacaulis sp. EMRT-3]MDI7776511.1 hypothetical protein [Asticcacaulis sp. EMRT-3]